MARATSIVRYAPHSHFSAHTHGGGEEFLVLDEFSRTSTRFRGRIVYPQPAEVAAYAGSASGCVIFVKLWQFDSKDRTQVRLDTTAKPFTPAPVGRAWS